ncbi:putative magnesium transporter NIPA4 [Diplonema papillatum]|nr:putative magnesium transporter NIPA4 [Diplonema papillatum]
MATPLPELLNITVPYQKQCGERAEDDAEVGSGLVWMGTGLVIAASFVSCFGVNLQKWAHNVNEAWAPEERVSMYKNWRWWLGIGCMILASVLDMVALPFVPLSRVAALGASTIVANIIITPLFLKEKLTGHDIVGCIITVAGTAIACYWGASGESDLDSYCILLYFEEGMFIAFISVVFGALAVLLYFVEGFRRMEHKAFAAGIVGGPGQPDQFEAIWIHENLDVVLALPKDPHFIFVTNLGPQFYPCVHATFGGVIGAQSVMFAKAVVLFLGNAARAEETGSSVGYMFLFLIPTVLCVMFQIKFLNIALKIYRDAIFILPVYQAWWICTGVGSGLIFYKEYRDINGGAIAAFVCGLLLALSGLVVLAKRKSRTDPKAVVALHPAIDPNNIDLLERAPSSDKEKDVELPGENEKEKDPTDNEQDLPRSPGDVHLDAKEDHPEPAEGAPQPLLNNAEPTSPPHAPM